MPSGHKNEAQSPCKNLEGRPICSPKISIPAAETKLGCVLSYLENAINKYIVSVNVRVLQVSRIKNKKNKKSTKKESNRIPFVVTFNPALPNIRQVISSNLDILRSSQRCQAAFPSPPLISYRRCNNLRDILVRAKLPLMFLLNN